MGVRDIWNRVISGWSEITSSRVVHAGRTAAGVYVDADTALKNATVWACVQYLTKTLGQLPWHVYTRDQQGNTSVSAAAGVDYLLNTRPNPEMGSFTWRQIMLNHVLLRGNAYAEIQRDNRGVAIALWPIHPDRVVARRRESGELYFEVWNSSGNTELPIGDMFHVRGLGDGPVGYSVIAYAAQSIGWAQATEVFGSTYFGEGMNPSMIIETPKGLSEAGMKRMRADLDKLYKGPKGQRTAILDAGMKATKLGTNPNDSQFIETRQHQVEEICRWFGVPPHKVMHLLRATFSNIEHQSIEVVVDAITPWARVFEQEADYKLWPANRQGFYTKLSLQALLRGDNASRLTFYKGLAHDLGVPLNRILALEELNGIGPDGDVSLISNNVQTLRHAIEGKPDPVVPTQTPQDTVDPITPQPERPANGIVLNRS